MYVLNKKDAALLIKDIENLEKYTFEKIEALRNSIKRFGYHSP